MLSPVRVKTQKKLLATSVAVLKLPLTPLSPSKKKGTAMKRNLGFSRLPAVVVERGGGRVGTFFPPL